MKYLVWFMAGILIVAGLLCLSIAPTVMAGYPIWVMIHSFVTVCFWTVVPIATIGLLYFLLTRKKEIR